MSKLLLLSLLSASIFAQQPTQHIVSGPILPSRCSWATGDVFALTSLSGTGLYLCGPTNTFSVGPLYTSQTNLSSLTNKHIYIGNISNIPVDVAVSGDISNTNTGVFTVNTVGTSTASNIHLAELAANAATSSNTASTIVARDVNGDFSTRDINGRQFLASSNVQAGTGGSIFFLNRSLIASPSDGVLTFSNNAVTSFTRLNFGGTTSSFPALKVNSTSLIARLADDSADTTFETSKLLTETNCSSSASPAVCGSAASGSFVIAAAGTSIVVDTTAVTANSIIVVSEDESLGTKLSVTCNTQSSLVLGTPRITARSNATSFTVAIDVGPTTNPMCVNYIILN